jgi:hypothetical protein
MLRWIKWFFTFRPPSYSGWYDDLGEMPDY